MAKKRNVRLERLTWRKERNATPEPALKGADAFCAWPEELPEARRWGRSEEEALDAAKKAARARLDELDNGTLDRILTPMAQLSIRIQATQKERILERAGEAGMTLTRFVLEQCLNRSVVKIKPTGATLEDMQATLKDVADRVTALERQCQPPSKAKPGGVH